MGFCILLSIIVACLQFILAFNGGAAGYGRHMPNTRLRLSIYNDLQVPIRRLSYRFNGSSSSIFKRVEAAIPKSSWDQINILADRPDNDVCGFVVLEIKDKGRGIPIALYFSIPSEHSSQIPWMGIEMYTDKPNVVLETAEKSSNVSHLNNEFRNFTNSERKAMISVADRWGLTLTAYMNRIRMNPFTVKLVVSKRMPLASTSIATSTTARSAVRYTNMSPSGTI